MAPFNAGIVVADSTWRTRAALAKQSGRHARSLNDHVAACCCRVPVIDEAVRAWIESVRRSTIRWRLQSPSTSRSVFPADVAAGEVSADADRVASEPPGPLTVRRATTIKDVTGAGGHVLLIPGEGSVEIVNLHDQLYRGVLQAHLRANIPFVPHITVGACADVTRCEALARQQNAEGCIVSGTLQSIDLVDAAARTRDVPAALSARDRSARVAMADQGGPPSRFPSRHETYQADEVRLDRGMGAVGGSC